MEPEAKLKTGAVVARYLRRRWRVPGRVALAALAITLLVGFQPFRPTSKPPEPQERFAVAPAEVLSLERSGIGSPFEGIVLAVEVQVGDRVGKGDLLFRMDTTHLERSLELEVEERAAAADLLERTRADYRREVSGLEREARELRAELARARRTFQQVPDDPRFYSGYPFTPRITFEQDAARRQIEQLEIALEDVRWQLGYRRSVWEPLIAAARERLTRADAEIERLTALIAQKERTSPRQGIVTSVEIRPGALVSAFEPLVRVDDPDGYRVVATIDRDRLERLPEDANLGVRLGEDRIVAAEIEKVEEGFDRDLFRSTVWLKPCEVDGIIPGSRLDLVIPLGRSEARMAQRRS